MRPAVRNALVLLLAGALALSACGEDGNDVAVRPAQSATIAAEQPAPTTVVDAAVPPAVTASNSSTAPATAPASPVAPTGVVVDVAALDNTFRPDRLEISVGDEVRWENRGLNEHDVLYVEGDDWGVQAEGFGPGASYAHVFTEPGEYRYFCSIHGNETVGMVGSIVVLP